MNTDLSLYLEFEQDIKSVDIIVQDRNETILADIKQLHDRPVKVNCKIKLPNKISIILNNQNNKFVKLSNLWLGNIEINQQTLLQMCEYKSDQLNTMNFTTVWKFNGIVTIDLFDKDFTFINGFILESHKASALK